MIESLSFEENPKFEEYVEFDYFEEKDSPSRRNSMIHNLAEDGSKMSEDLFSQTQESLDLLGLVI